MLHPLLSIASHIGISPCSCLDLSGLLRADLGGLRATLSLGLHRGEEQHFLDVLVVGEEHGEAIDAKTPASGGRQAVLQRGAEVLIYELRFVITGILRLCTTPEER